MAIASRRGRRRYEPAPNWRFTQRGEAGISKRSPAGHALLLPTGQQVDGGIVDDEPVAIVVSAPELEMMEDAIAAMPLRIDRLAASPGGVTLTRHAVHGVSIVTGRTPLPIHSQGEVDRDSVVFGLQLSDGDGRWNGHEFSLERMWCYPPGTEHWGIASATPWWAAISLRRSVAERAGLGGMAERSETSVLTSRSTRVLADAIRSVSVLSNGDLRPHMLRIALADVVDLIVGTVADGVAGDGRCTATAAATVVRECEALTSSLGPIPRVAALAEALDMSDRWIRAAFARFYGVSPSRYFRARAINGARRDLLRAPPRSTTTAAVAMHWGFWHLGRFAQMYREYFSELPSTTLARPAERPAGPRKSP